MKDIKTYLLEGFKLGQNKVRKESDDNTYIVYEFSLNELHSDSYLSKCARETYGNRSIIARGYSGVRFYMHILTIKEFKSCYAKWPKSSKSIKYVWKAPEEIQGKSSKDVEKYIKNNTDEIDYADLTSGEKIKIDVRE